MSCYPGLLNVLLSRIAKCFACLPGKESKKLTLLSDSFAILLTRIVLKNWFPGYPQVLLSWIAKPFAILDR